MRLEVRPSVSFSAALRLESAALGSRFAAEPAFAPPHPRFAWACCALPALPRNAKSPQPPKLPRSPVLRLEVRPSVSFSAALRSESAALRLESAALGSRFAAEPAFLPRPCRDLPRCRSDLPRSLLSNDPTALLRRDSPTAIRRDASRQASPIRLEKRCTISKLSPDPALFLPRPKHRPRRARRPPSCLKCPDAPPMDGRYQEITVIRKVGFASSGCGTGELRFMPVNIG